MTEIVYCSHLPSFTHLSTCTRRYETSPPPKAIIKPGAELQPHLHWHHQSPQIHHHHHPRHPYYHHHHYSHSPITPLPTAAWIATPVMMVSTSTHTQKASSRNCAFEWESIGTPKIHSVHSIEKELSIYGAHRCPNCSIRMWRKPTRWYPNPKISLSECEFPCSQRFPVSKHIIRWKSAHDFFPHRKLRSSRRPNYWSSINLIEFEVWCSHSCTYIENPTQTLSPGGLINSFQQLQHGCPHRSIHVSWTVDSNATPPSSRLGRWKCRAFVPPRIKLKNSGPVTNSFRGFQVAV